MKTQTILQFRLHFHARRPLSWRSALWFFAITGLCLSLYIPRLARAQDAAPLDSSAAWFSADADDSLSVAWGDVDGDGDLDLAAGNRNEYTRIYLNQGGILETTAAWTSDIKDHTYSVAWGDMDGDGDLDLAVGNDGYNKVYVNQGGDLQTTATWVANDPDITYSVAWGDVNGDGYLDLVVGNSASNTLIYLNQGGVLTTTASWSSSDGSADDTRSVAWGDVDGDGDLDLAVGNNGGPNKVYMNQGKGLQTTAAWSTGAGDTDQTESVAWGDVDGDGDLDLAAGNFGGTNKVYWNQGGVLQTSSPWVSGDADNTESVAWGDVDGDGDLDLAAGNNGEANKVYLNQEGSLGTTAAWSSSDGDNKKTLSVAWGDVDGDGDLDLAAGYHAGPNQIYLNDGGGLQTNADEPWSSGDADKTRGVAWGDVDGDGNLDLAAGNGTLEQSKVYLNRGGILQMDTDTPWSSDDGDANNTMSVAWGDVNKDGGLDLAVGNSISQNQVYLNWGRGLTTTADWSSSDGDADDSWSVAWGDVDGDGDLDLAVGNDGGANKVYLNQDGVLTTTASWVSDDTNSTYGVAWGDVDGDGDLDLAAGNNGGANRIYLNQGGVLQTRAGWVSGDTDYTLSIAWGDVDGDGDLDLAVGNGGEPNKVYLNQGGSLGTAAAWASNDTDSTYSVAWGDADGDGDLDLAAGNFMGPNRVYLNQGGSLLASSVWSTGASDQGRTLSVAWGDVDGDGDLDLAAGNQGESNKVYLNGRQGMQTLPNNGPALKIIPPYATARADFYASPLILVSPTLPLTCTLFDPEGNTVGRVEAWFSLDGGDNWQPAVATTDTITTNLPTGRLVRASNVYSPPEVIPNNAVLSFTLPVSGSGTIADLDVSLSIDHDATSTDLHATLVSPGGDHVLLFSGVDDSVGGFLDMILDDQALELIASGMNDPSIRAYRPQEELELFNGRALSGTWRLVITDSVPAAADSLIAWGLRIKTLPATHVYTWDTFASGVFGQSDNVVVRMVAYPQPPTSAVTEPYRYTNTVSGPYQRPYASAATFPFRVRGAQVQVYSETEHISNTVENAMVYRLPAEQSTGGTPLADSGGVPFRTDHHGYLQGRGKVGLGDRLFAMVPVHTATNYEGVLVFDGEDDYVIANPLDNAPITATTISFWISSTQTSGGAPFSYASPVTDSTLLITNPDGFVVYRGNGVSVTTPVTVTDGTWHHIAVTWHSSDGQVRLYKDGLAAFTDTLTTTQMSTGGSLVLGKDQNGSGFFAGSLDEVRIWNIVLTETQILDDMFGLLGENEPGQVVYWSFDDPENPARDRSDNSNDGTLYGPTWIGDYIGGYTVYHTSATPTETGLDAFTVAGPGVQTITVTAQHPLILFDVDVSLEWDASNDLNDYLGQLEIDLKRASKHLYDFTDGQVALGQVIVHQNADNWAYSHIAVHATNRLRPFAVQGGIVLTATVDPDHDDIIYDPGQVHMGATWNRYGTPGQNQGVDWPLILAHELGHYFLYLDDVYLGLNEDGLLIPVRTCTGSAMGDVYNPDNTEFISDTRHWTDYCTDTLTAKTLDRTEWGTIQLWYPWLVTPVVTNTGPSRMPFDFTTVTILDPITPTDALIDPTFYLDYQGGVVSSSEARAFLLRNGGADPPMDADDFEYVYDLGSPIGGQNRVLARGAQPGDRLCVFDRHHAQYGCEVIQDGDEQLQLEQDESWTPVIQLSPVNSTTFDIQISGLSTDTLNLKARLYPEYGSAFTVTALSYVSATESYSGTLHLAYLSMVGHVRIWVDEGTEPTELDPRPEMIVVYSIGGNPGWARAGGGWARAGGGWARAGGGWARAGGGWARAGGGWARAGGAPLLSPDGQMIFFTENPIVFNVGEFYAIQTMAGLPSLPPGRTLISQGYNMVASSNFTREITGSISIQYLGSDVLAAGANEDDLTLYYRGDDDWVALDTVLDTYFNMASAPSQGTGVYALMASVKIPLYGPGWNLVSYPVRGARAITEALESISGTYAIVYGYVATGTVGPGSDPWRVYGTDVPSYVNRLHELQFGQGYWISATETVTWYIGGESEALAASDVQNMQSPPATYYGSVLAGQGITPTTGMTVTAWVNSKPCGQGQTMEMGGEVVYSIHVFADGPGGAAGCGEPGERVAFWVGGQAMSPTAVWDNNRLWELALRPAWQAYLPLVLRH